MVPPSGVLGDIKDGILEILGVGVFVVIGGRGLGGVRDVANEGVHLETAGYHCGIYCLLPHL